MKNAFIFGIALLLLVFTGAPSFAGNLFGGDCDCNIIGVWGDSYGNGVEAGLVPLVRSHPHDKVFNYTGHSDGLASGDFTAWMHRVSENIERDHINVAVVLLGAGDHVAIPGENGEEIPYKSEEWQRVYTARMFALLSEFRQRKVIVFWLGLPTMADPEANDNSVYLNTLSTAVFGVGSRSYVPLYALFPETSGRMRSDDGFGFSPYGNSLIAEKVYAVIDGLAMKARPPRQFP